jgi:hypothetical protein
MRFSLPLLIASAIFLSACTGPTNGPQSGNQNQSTVPLASNRQVKLDQFSPPASSDTPSPSAPLTCSNGKKVAVNLLLDTSGSMASGNKIGKMKDAVIQFGDQFSENDVLGVQQFNSGASDVVPLNLYKNNRSQYKTAIANLRPTGYTHMKEGFTLAQQKVNAARPNYPDHIWVFIFLSDGVPRDQQQSIQDSLSEPGYIRPHESQNPTQIATAIKNSGIRLISIGLDLDNPNNGGPHNAQYGKQLMRSLASSPSDYYESATGDDLARIYSEIAQKICE